MYKNRKAVSPVIATVILVAVAITISVAVAYWMGGISSQYTKFEKVEVSNALVTAATTGTTTTWTIDLTLKNTGTQTCTINDLFVNNMQLAHMAAEAEPATTAGNGAWAAGQYVTGTWNAGLVTIPSGAMQHIGISIQNTGATTDPFYNLSAGTTLNIRLHSAGGMDYLKLCELV